MLKLMKSEKGFTLIEVLVALGLLGIIAVVFLTGISISSRAVLIADERTTAESLARSQMEYVKEQPYDDVNPYLILSDVPANYSIAVTVLPLADGLQKITVAVSHPGEPEPILTLEGYKVDR